MFENFSLQTNRSIELIFRNWTRRKRHYDFVGNIEEEENCYRPQDYNENITDACQFVKTTPSCSGVVSLINYLYIFECILHWDASLLWGLPAMTLAVFILLLYAISLYVNASLLPNSIALAKYLNIPSYDFGCLVLGILFTLPCALCMIFACFEYNRSDSLLHAMTFGKIFTCWVMGLGLLSYRGGFRFKGRIFLRDMLFLTLGWVYLYAAVFNEMLNENQEEYLKAEPTIHIHAYISIVIYMLYIICRVFSLRRYFRKPNIVEEVDILSTSIESIESDSYPDLLYNEIDLSVQPWQQFWNCINPMKALGSHSILSKILLSPFYILLALLIPVVNPERHLAGWCKAISCGSCLIFPLLLFTLDLDSYTMFSLLILGISVTLLIIFLTHSQRIPTNHELLSLWGLVMGFMLFNIVDLEICCILWQFLNYFFDMDNDDILILAFPFSYVFVEGIFVVTLMENDYREMALGFVMGSVLFIAYSALPVMLFSVCFGTNHVYSLTDNTTTAFYFMAIVECVTIFGFSLSGYELRPSFSVFLGTVAFIFALFMILENEQVIHAYGTMHSRTVFVDVMHNQWA
ncbi:mitochondrial sodium/calcium exchanger protein isoform X2 [Musca domestica]|uniref:Mitochondrial sodium/calcium exchanger protein isoform X2 n=2 Tax=Musca domestica TaxID=7370 RepID=A0A9J7D352_MUSDO|nr:mitochondrial sodium/calcium exchanger protein isoform X2 [Musca domestica]